MRPVHVSRSESAVAAFARTRIVRASIRTLASAFTLLKGMPRRLRSQARLLATLILLAAVVWNPLCRVARAETAAAHETNAAQAVRLVNDLNSDEYAARELAMEQLRDLGRAAVDPLVSAAREGNPEVAWRAVVTLHLITSAADLPTQDAAFNALESLAERAPSAVSDQAARILSIPGYDRHHRAVVRLRQLGGSVAHGAHKPTTVRIDENWLGGDDGLVHLTRLERLGEVKLERSSVTDAGLSHLANLHTIEKLYLGNSHVQGAGLEHVARMQGLKYLSLRGLELERDAFEALSDATGLEHLGLDETNVSDDDLRHLAKLTKLQRLWLNKTKISGQGLRHLQKLPRLSTLFLSQTSVRGPTIEPLQKLRSLRYLSFQHVAIRDSDAKYLSKLDQITTLGVDDTLIGDAGVKQLQGLKNLRTLWLINTNITDSSIESLKRLSRLQRLYLQGTEVTASGVKDLVRTLPNCRVEWQNAARTNGLD